MTQNTYRLVFTKMICLAICMLGGCNHDNLSTRQADHLRDLLQGIDAIKVNHAKALEEPYNASLTELHLLNVTISAYIKTHLNPNLLPADINMHFQQWVDSLNRIAEIQETLLDEGRVMKDATPDERDALERELTICMNAETAIKRSLSN